MQESEVEMLRQEFEQELKQLRFESEMNEIVIEGLRSTVIRYRNERDNAVDTIKGMVLLLEHYFIDS